MITLERRINAFVKLGNFLKAFSKKLSGNSTQYEELDSLINKTAQHNSWFLRENILLAIEAIADLLEESSLIKWMEEYNEDFNKENSQKVAVIMAGNIPLIGFHDMLSVLISGHQFIGKLSSQDPYLLPYLGEILIEIEPEFKKNIQFQERLSLFQAVIATGSNNTSRYFEYYFREYPHIIRKNRTSVAILNKTESAEDLKALGKDIFRYFGLGCRNVSKLYLAQGYDLTVLFEALESFSNIIQHNKYANNYNYYKTVFLMNKISFHDNGFLLLKEDSALATPTSVIHYEFYKNADDLINKINLSKDKIQCIISKGDLIKNSIPFGRSQHPQLWDYADGVDTIKFLSNLN